jgi:hypothetical protein
MLDATLEFGGDDRADELRAAFDVEHVRIGRPPRLGPDGVWRYGWDERLRLGRGRTLRLERIDGPPVTGVYEVSERSGSVLVVRTNGHVERVAARAVYDVRPA